MPNNMPNHQYGGFLNNGPAMQAVLNALRGPNAPKTPPRNNTKGKKR